MELIQMKGDKTKYKRKDKDTGERVVKEYEYMIRWIFWCAGYLIWMKTRWNKYLFSLNEMECKMQNTTKDESKYMNKEI